MIHQIDETNYKRELITLALLLKVMFRAIAGLHVGILALLLSAMCAWATTKCPVERAVYLADNKREGTQPDELRFDFSKPDPAVPRPIGSKTALR